MSEQSRSITVGMELSRTQCKTEDPTLAVNTLQTRDAKQGQQQEGTWKQ